jgi:hypothetical protein
MMQKDYPNYELEIRAEVGDLLLNQLDERPELAQAIFDELIGKYNGRNYPHKILTNLTLCAVNPQYEDDRIEFSLGNNPSYKPLPRLKFSEILKVIDEGIALRRG